jgi:ankyrin repeat protein
MLTPARGTIKGLRRLASRTVLPGSNSNATNNIALSSGPSLRVNPKTVKRKSEGNIHQSIDLSTKDGLSAPAIVRAAQLGSSTDIEQLIQQRVDIEQKHEISGRTALAVGSHCGNDTVVAMLLRYSAKVDATDALGMSPIHLAASRATSALWNIFCTIRPMWMH